MTLNKKMQIKAHHPQVHGWLETRLLPEAMKHLWDCIETARGERWNDKLVGHIESSFTIQDKDDWFWKNVIRPHIKYYGEQFNHDHCKVPVNGDFDTYLDRLWVNYQNKHEFNPFHNHGGMYSFAIWMKIPTYHDQQNQLDNAKHVKQSTNSAFSFQYIDTVGDIINCVYPMNPFMEGHMVFFPARLMHSVNPFYNCDEQRISIAGNVSLKLRGG